MMMYIVTNSDIIRVAGYLGLALAIIIAFVVVCVLMASSLYWRERWPEDSDVPLDAKIDQNDLRGKGKDGKR